ncbi:hypothetical protein [Spongiivirga citrea]|uniref:Uncharacterized protein n=1 Tax=Spongiivirga citrea TaxID=1481457 RepID=A0A6M0CGS1_9FLAO|nr:hypothetical protein [Spongiivirga citrea]NER17015.1 hypothetical protein [Spongiivirga citrea]
MKGIIVSIFLLATTHLTLSQNKNIEEHASNTEKFSSRAGALIEKEFIELGTINKMEVQILKITDMISGDSISSLRVQNYAASNYSSTKIANLDTDEIDGLIKSLKIINGNVLTSTVENYTEISFKSRSGFEAGCYWSKGKWILYLKIDKNDRNSMILLKQNDYIKLIRLLELAKNQLK